VGVVGDVQPPIGQVPEEKGVDRSAQHLAALGASLGADLSEFLQYVAVGVTGAYFLYYGLKAVQLTEMANRVWKRSAEYALIVAERRRLRAAADRPTDPSR